VETPVLSFHSGSSSNSSLSTRSLDSPSVSLEAVAPSASSSASSSAALAAAAAANSSASAAGTSAGTPGVAGGYPPHTEWDSDTEAEPDPPDWTKGVGEDVLKNLSVREKKRQEVINGE